MHEVIINNIQNKIILADETSELIKQIVVFSLCKEEVKAETEVGVLLVDNNYIKDLNCKYRQKNVPTDVLSFAMRDTLPGCVPFKILAKEREPLGDIVISVERALEQAKDFGHSFEREIGYLTVHGILHLLGYDHETIKSKTLMRRKEEDILKTFDLIRKGK